MSARISSGTVTKVPPPSLPYHPHFQPSDSTDITFRSSDGILFCVHRKNLDVHAESFPGPEIPVNLDEQVNLTEPAEILAIVFDFVYPRKHADIEMMSFKVVIQVAEAVEKYRIFSAMKACELGLKQFISTNPYEILSHGIEHDYPGLIEAVLPNFSRKRLVLVIRGLPPQYHLAWCRHHEAWTKIFRSALETYRKTPETIHQILQWEALDDVKTLRKALEKTARIGTNYSSSAEAVNVKAAQFCLERIKQMPPFSLR